MGEHNASVLDFTPYVSKVESLTMHFHASTFLGNDWCVLEREVRNRIGIMFLATSMHLPVYSYPRDESTHWAEKGLEKASVMFKVAGLLVL